MEHALLPPGLLRRITRGAAATFRDSATFNFEKWWRLGSAEQSVRIPLNGRDLGASDGLVVGFGRCRPGVIRGDPGAPRPITRGDGFKDCRGYYSARLRAAARVELDIDGGRRREQRTATANGGRERLQRYHTAMSWTESVPGSLQLPFLRGFHLRCR